MRYNGTLKQYFYVFIIAFTERFSVLCKDFHELVSRIKRYIIEVALVTRITDYLYHLMILGHEAVSISVIGITASRFNFRE